LLLPQAKAQDLDRYSTYLRQLEHVPKRPRAPTNQLSMWRSVMPGRIPNSVWSRAANLGISRDDVITPYWSRTERLSGPMEVDHIIEMQVTPINNWKKFDTMAFYRLMDASKNGPAGPELDENIARMREALTECYQDQSWMYRLLRFEKVAASPTNRPDIWTKDDLVAGKHIDAYEKLRQRGLVP